jgi:putative oxidoreductase
MKTAALICRILLGLMFVVFGLNGILLFIPGSDAVLPGLAGQFSGALMKSHYEFAVCVIQIAGGLLLLSGFYVPLGLVLLGPVIVNILLFHLFMLPAMIGPGIVATILWLIIFIRNREHFAGIFVKKTS